MPNSDLISREAAIDYLMTNMGWHDADGYEVDDADEKRAIITDLVNGIPAIDAVPVVRCRDCKYWNISCKSRYFGDWYFCDMQSFTTPPHWFCADGERRDGGEDDAESTD